jgi:hypothetical protein
MNRPPFETFKHPTCRGCYALGTACGKCEKCEWERSQPGFKVGTLSSSVEPSVERQPFYVHCASCKHEWVAFYTPMDVTTVAKIGKRAICPSCGSTKVNCGKRRDQEPRHNRNRR